MKKHLLSTFALAFACSAAIVAQPVLNASGINPVLGDILMFNNASYVNPGAAGANQTWNLTSMAMSSTSNYTVTSVASTPYSASFSNSNLSMNANGVYSYFNLSSSAFQNTGAYGGGVTFSYSNPEDLLHYPFNYTNSYSDTWAVNFTSSGYSFARTGTTTVTYDGYGTLALPSGTFTNVSRVHFVQDYQDVYVGGTIHYNNDEYLWYKPGNHYSIASVSTLSNSVSGPPSQTGTYLGNVATGVNEAAAPSVNVTMFPNPAANEVYVSLPGNVMVSEANIYSLDGRLVQSTGADALQAANGELTISTANLQPGIYFVKLVSKDVSINTKKIIVSR